MGVKTWIGTFLLLVILSTSVYVMMPDKVKIVVEDTKTSLYYYEDVSIGSDWHLLATEYMYLWDGSAKMRAKNRSVDYFVDENITKIIRTANYKDNITSIQTYIFYGNVTNEEDVPISHEAECFNCEGKIVSFEYRDIPYEEETKEVDSPFIVDRLSVLWNEPGYLEKVYNYKTTSSKLMVRYKPESDYESYSIRMFDPFPIEDVNISNFQWEVDDNNYLVGENVSFNYTFREEV